MTHKKKLLIIQMHFPHYRKYLFTELNKRYEVELLCLNDVKSDHGIDFVRCIKSYYAFGFLISPNLHAYVKMSNPDVIIAPANLRLLNVILLGTITRFKSLFIWWGLDKGNIPGSNFLKSLIFKNSNSFLFYAQKALSEFHGSLNKTASLRVARNTVYVKDFNTESNKRSYFLNVGSLNKRKRNDLLILAFKKYCKSTKRPLNLVFVGDGSEKKVLLDLAKKEGMSSKVSFFNHLDSSRNELYTIYSEAVASISLGQAGLSILQSFGHSRPYITLKNAISGGELENIIDGYNGFVCNDLEHVIEKMVECTEDHKLRLRLEKNCSEYYRNRASMPILVSTFIEAVDEILESRGLH